MFFLSASGTQLAAALNATALRSSGAIGTEGAA